MSKGSGNTRSGRRADVFDRISADGYAAHGSGDGRTMQGYIAEVMGVNGTPTLVSDKEFEALSKKEGNITLYRGYRQNEDENIANFKKSKKYYEGTGAIAEGHYFFDEKVSNFSQTGKHVEAIVDTRKMKIADYDKLREQYVADQHKLKEVYSFDKYTKLKTKKERENFKLRSKIYDNFGRWATAKGYDGVIVKGKAYDREYIIFSRSKLIVKR